MINRYHHWLQVILAPSYLVAIQPDRQDLVAVSQAVQLGARQNLRSLVHWSGMDRLFQLDLLGSLPPLESLAQTNLQVLQGWEINR